jgi:biopolymer transport protein ExbD
MAEMISNNQQSGKRKKHATRVDLTPMVDLGFLLITFFVFTTTMSMAKAMKVNLPMDDLDNPTTTYKSGALTLMPDANKVFYYVGDFATAQKNKQIYSADFSGVNSIRQVILSLKRNLIKLNGTDEKLMVMIKPTNNCNLKHTVDVLDEMTLNNVRRYAMVDISKEESQHIPKD